jgi:nicotinate phosphoribosyltransferase
MKHDIDPKGTVAHETDMAISGIMHDSDETIRKSHNQFLRDWWNEYGYGLSIALTDTYGTDFFYKDMTTDQARKWKGVRQDSGDPIEFIRKTERFYEKKGIDPGEKLALFSDGLDIQKILKIADTPTRLRKSYGWGTNLTNDLGFRPLSLVVKLVESNGYGTVKLSDNIAKAIGKPEDVRRFKRIFEYKVKDYEETVY